MMLGRLAADRGGSEDIRDFGRQLAADHNQAEDRVIRIASRDDVNLPARIEAGAQQFYDRAERLRGRAFDRAFRAYMIRDHRKDIRTYERFSRMARDPEIRRYATRTLPDLRKHLQLAESAKV
jgi:putative membrane protein